MKRIFFVLGIIALFAIGGCLKEDKVEPCVPRTLEQDKPVMTQFAADSAITVTEDPTGLFYQVIDPGTGAAPTATSTVTVKYVGRYTDNGQRVDASNLDREVSFTLNGVIQGWTIGIPKIKAGGKIKMIIPSSLGYGCYQGTRMNQPLYFYVELISVK
ncbi:FKBP-type peptidyl-prolyl cis-trans isomerase [Niabella defluvii]|nr:FKBP-type peptidyl-prolyl cis-trans isomerase [Niabella sp. I65]